MGAPAWVSESKDWDPPPLIIMGGWVCSLAPPPLMLVGVPLCAGVPFLKTSFFGFVLLCNLASTAVGWSTQEARTEAQTAAQRVSP